MADEQNVCQVSSFENVGEILSLFWGENVKEDIFKRWSQGNAFERLVFYIGNEVFLQVKLMPNFRDSSSLTKEEVEVAGSVL